MSSAQKKWAVSAPGKPWVRYYSTLDTATRRLREATAAQGERFVHLHHRDVPSVIAREANGTWEVTTLSHLDEKHLTDPRTASYRLANDLRRLLGVAVVDLPSLEPTPAAPVLCARCLRTHRDLLSRRAEATLQAYSLYLDHDDLDVLRDALTALQDALPEPRCDHLRASRP